MAVRKRFPVQSKYVFSEARGSLACGAMLCQSPNSEQSRKHEQHSGFVPPIAFQGCTHKVIFGALIRIPSSPDYVRDPSTELEEAWKELRPGK